MRKYDYRDMISVDDDGCWAWLGAYHDGRPTWGGRKAHRRVYHEVVGSVPPVLHHRCRNRKCVNPAHMQGFDTQTEHMQEHPDNPGFFQKGGRPWSAGRVLIDGPYVVSGKQRRRLYPITCEVCGEASLNRRRDGKFCSVRCSLTNARSKRARKDNV
jgi:hypothetical protein